ncbi:MAG: bacterioferritin [Thiotrichaceae bacterium]|nr:bacterioferritin [Thiotrichaceae bacterium]
MNGNREVIRLLNEVLGYELVGINQYLFHEKMVKHWGFSKLNNKECPASVHAMKCADRLIERVLFLEGLPNLYDLGPLYIGENVAEILKLNRMLNEKDVIPTLRVAIAHCETVKDYVSRELLDSILEKKEGYLDWLETQQSLIQDAGLENYQQSMM